MLRTPITETVVEEIDQLLAQDVALEVIAKRLNITPYVVGVIAGDESGRGRQPPPGRYDGRAANGTQGIDAITIRRIERMLAVGWLEQEQVAREAGVSPNTVSEIALGRRPYFAARYRKSPKGQLILRDPIRCLGCGALVNIVPCQACYTRLTMAIDELLKTYFFRFRKISLPAWRAFVILELLMEHLKRTRGAKAMQDVTMMLSTEIAAFVGAADKREYLISRAEILFDEVVEPIDLPGPDKIIDPLLRAAIRPLVGRVYDEMLKKLEAPINVAA
jgi:transcriptional regulator with XRE-family HTH domain